MKKLVLAFLGLVVLSGCIQDKTLTPNTQEVHADQLTFFEAAEAMKQRYFTLSQQLEDGTYAQDDSWYYQLPTEIKKEWFYFLRGMKSAQMMTDFSSAKERMSALALPVFYWLETQVDWDWFMHIRGMAPTTISGERITLPDSSVRLPVRLPAKYYLNTHLLGEVRENSIDITVKTDKHSPDMDSEEMVEGEKTFHFSAGERFDINPWKDEELRPTNAIKDYIYFYISSADWGVFDYEFKF